VIRWVLSTQGKVGGLTLITLRGFPKKGVEFVEGDKVIDLNAPSIGMVNDVEDELSTLRSNDLYRTISGAFPGYEAASYLGGTKTMSSFKWLIANAICCNGDIVGSVSPTTVEIAQTVHHLRYGRYYAGGRGRVGKMILLMAAVDRRIRRVLIGLLRRPGRLFGKIYTLTVSVIEPNTLSPDGEFEMCDSCPDMTYHEGRLVHSCRLDEYRIYGSLVKPVVTAD
jgi:hypothetical protein